VDGRYLLEQQTGRAVPIERVRRDVVLRPSAPQLPPPSDSARIPLVTRLPAPKMTFHQFDGTERPVAVGTGKPVLLNLWASWCAPCLEELKEFTVRQSDIRAAGIDIIALSIDGLGDDPSQPDDARTYLSRLAFPFTSGHATSNLVSDLERHHDNLILMWRPLPVPTSFLFDSQGRLAVIYKGRLSVDDLLRDAHRQVGNYADRFEEAACLAGQALDHDRVRERALVAETRTRYHAAAAFQTEGRLEEAARGFLELVQTNPQCADAHARLASIFLSQGDFARAAEHCQNALQIDPDSAGVHNTLGNVLSSQGNPPLAKFHYEQAIRIDPQSAEAHNNLGALLAGQRHFEQAAIHFNRAIQIDPNFAEAHNNLGSVYASLGDLSQAEAHYADTIRVDPNYAEAHNNLGTIHARRGNLAQAVVHYRRALEIDPTYAQARQNLERAEAQLGTR
jgi:tetratricopeptide (TPR) repeat protein